MKRSEAISLLCEFLEKIDSNDVQEIVGMKRTATQSKDNRILIKLENMFTAYEKDL